MFRVITLSLAAVIGVGIAAGYVLARQSVSELPVGDTFATQGFVLQVVSLFILGMYNGEIGILSKFRPEEARQARRTKRAHMIALNGFAAATFAMGFFLD